MITFEQFVASKVLMTRSAYERAYGIDPEGQTIRDNVLVYLDGFIIEACLDRPGRYCVDFCDDGMEGTLEEVEEYFWDKYVEQEMNPIPKELKEAAQELKNAFIKLNNVWGNDAEYEDLLGQDYPFKGCFNELTHEVIKWLEKYD